MSFHSDLLTLLLIMVADPSSKSRNVDTVVFCYRIIHHGDLFVITIREELSWRTSSITAIRP